ncbi:unnamed protein product [Rotaria sp. Silwood2]|nr:unnamed protein product [Rotaria sp. Silwood2]
MRCSSNDDIYPMRKKTINRFCLQILPQIHHKIQWLNIEASSMKRILLSNEYPNLYGLGLYNVKKHTIERLFTDEPSLAHILKTQISTLILKISQKQFFFEDSKLNMFSCVLNVFTNLRCLNFDPCYCMEVEPITFNYQVNQNFSSTILRELHMNVKAIDHCLCILDGRFSQLEKFYVNIDMISRYTSTVIISKQSTICFLNQIHLPSNEEISHTFSTFKYNRVISCVDYFPKQDNGRCHIYSHPYTMKHYKNITNNFPSGLFKCVREISLFDERPFEHEFFIRIAQAFPYLTKLSLNNKEPQQYKQCQKIEDENSQKYSIIKYPYLTELILFNVHNDYIEQFLDETKTRLPNNVIFCVKYEPLRCVTHNFTRNTTRANCAKLKDLFIYDRDIGYSQQIVTYFPYLKAR